MRNIGSSHQLSGNLHIPHYLEEGGSSRAQVGAETSSGVKMKEMGASDQGVVLEKEPQESGYVLEAEWMGFADELDQMDEREVETSAGTGRHRGDIS